jgi:hypothetical protein
MDQSNLTFGSLSQSLLNTPVSPHFPLCADPPSNRYSFDHDDAFADTYPQTYNEFDAAFGLASNSNSYAEPPSGPQSPSYSHSHDDTTGDESGDFFPSNDSISVKPRTMETRKRKPGNRKAVQPQDQILKRRVQNRAAQRSFRERQKEYVHDLEHQVEELKGEITKLHENYQELLKAVTSAPRIPQWSADVSPASLDDLDYNGSVDGRAMEPIKVEGNFWPVSTERNYQGLLYA